MMDSYCGEPGLPFHRNQKRSSFHLLYVILLHCLSVSMLRECGRLQRYRYSWPWSSKWWRAVWNGCQEPHLGLHGHFSPQSEALIPSLHLDELQKSETRQTVKCRQNRKVMRNSCENFTWVSSVVFATMFLWTKTRGFSASWMNCQWPRNCWDPD